MAYKLTPRKEYYRCKNVNFCCVCGDDKSPSRFTKLFSTVGKQKKLSKLIYSLTNFELEESDNNAECLKVCRSCERKLEKSADFQTCAIATRCKVCGKKRRLKGASHFLQVSLDHRLRKESVLKLQCKTKRRKTRCLLIRIPFMISRYGKYYNLTLFVQFHNN